MVFITPMPLQRYFACKSSGGVMTRWCQEHSPKGIATSTVRPPAILPRDIVVSERDQKMALDAMALTR